MTETDYEIRRLAHLWNTTIVDAWARCCHYVATRKVSDIAGIEKAAAMRQAEAKVEMLKADL
jgi:hypothetical protein